MINLETGAKLEALGLDQPEVVLEELETLRLSNNKNTACLI